MTHFIYAYSVRKQTQQFLADEYLNTKQNFIIRSRNIGYIILAIQIVNFVKEVFYFLESVSIFLNFLFDLYPLVLLWFFFQYTR